GGGHLSCERWHTRGMVGADMVTVHVAVLLMWAGIVAAVAVQFTLAVQLWRRSRPLRFTPYRQRGAGLDAPTTALLQALDPLPIEEAIAVLREVRELLDATQTVSRLWPDATKLTAGAAVARAAAAGGERRSGPTLLK